MRMVVIIGSVLINGCVSWNEQVFFADSAYPATQLASHEFADATIFVVGHGWHTGIVIPTNAIPQEDWPESAAFDSANFVEVGWGDEGFYRAKSITLGVTAKALFVPTSSVLHVVGINKSPVEVFSHSDVIEVPVTRQQLAKLCQFIHETYEWNEDGQPIALGPGLYGDSYFYRAHESYYFPKTCNVWTAKALRVAGLPTNPLLSTTAGGVVKQARKFGVVRSQSSPMALWHALGFGQ